MPTWFIITCGNWSHQSVGDLDYRAIGVVHKLEHILIILLLKQENTLFQQNYMENHIFLSLFPQGKRSFVDKFMFGQLKVLKKNIKTDLNYLNF